MFPSHFPRRRIAGALLALALPAAAQLDLGGVSIRTVRAADAGVVALPRFDSVGIDVKVEGGVARTRTTLVWAATAGARSLYHWRCRAPEPETTFVSERSWLDYNQTGLHHDTTITYWQYNWGSEGVKDSVLVPYTYRVSTCRVEDISYQESKLDSLEVSASFSLPTDAAVTDLDLWVGDVKQSAWIMDRWQASAQYNSIVGVRRDPALLETWGSGSYSLRVFPQKTGETRRLEFEVTQAWRPGMSLPVQYKKAPGQSTWIWSDTGYTIFERLGQAPAMVGLTLRSLDGTPVRLDLGSLGTLTAGAEAQSRVFPQPGAFAAQVGTGAGEVWSAVRDGRPAFGARLHLKGGEFTVAPEPRERLILLDATLVSERARRLALLALMQYGTTDGNKVDLAWRDAQGNLVRLWGKPREFTAEAAAEAVGALKAWKPSQVVDPLAAIQGLLASDSGRVIVLLSDADAPSFTEPAPSTWVLNAEGVSVWDYTAYNAWSERSNAFYQSRRDALSALGDSLQKRDMKLFGWWRDWNLSSASEATGGYGFGDLQWGSWSWWRTGDSLVVPELFGARRRGWDEGFQGLDLSHSGLDVDSLAHDLGGDSRYWWWWDGPMVVRERPLVFLAARTAPAAASRAARAVSVAPPESLVVTLAGRQKAAGTLKVEVGGFWGGLKVTASRNLQVPVSGGAAGASLWAYEYTRSVQPWIWSFDSITDAVRNLGRTYRVATTATSFLALEPGMVPFDSLGGQGEDAKSGESRSASLVTTSYSTADMAVASSTGDILLDSLSLESLLIGRVLAVQPKVRMPLEGMKLIGGKGLEILAGASDEAPRVRILDIAGREIAAPEMVRSGDGWRGSWRPARSTVVVVQMVQQGRPTVRRAVVQP